ncbi:MAG: hypothetical protein HYS44_01200 [Candidatus Niyogibacteria bacterium]|nr:hypothetical protein [Candidatus Niyogibacteria bacterium]
MPAGHCVPPDRAGFIISSPQNMRSLAARQTQVGARVWRIADVDERHPLGPHQP